MPLMIARTLLPLFLLLLSASAAEHRGRIVGITDGDTLTFLEGTTPLKVRLHGVDAPEMGQAYGRKAKQALSAIAHGKSAVLHSTGSDRYGRITGTVLVDGRSVGLQLIEQGLAHWYSKYSGDRTLRDAEKAARAARRGLWSQTHVQTPAEWRAGRKRARALKRARESGDTEAVLSYWLNTGSNVRHNQSCRWHRKTKRGRACSSTEGKACGQCGG